jgi:hypothetical protein
MYLHVVYRQTARDVATPVTKCQISTASLNKEHEAFRYSNCYKHPAAHSSLLSSPHLTLDTCSLYNSIACKVALQVVGFEQVIVFPVGAQHLYGCEGSRFLRRKMKLTAGTRKAAKESQQRHQ